MKFSHEFIDAALHCDRTCGAPLQLAISKCARAGSVKAGDPEHSAHVEQEFWMYLMSVAGKFDDQYDIKQGLIEAARRTTLATGAG